MIGKTGATQGILSIGQVYGGINDGVTVHPALYVSSGGSSGSTAFLHTDVSGNTRLTGIIASHSGAQVTINP